MLVIVSSAQACATIMTINGAHTWSHARHDVAAPGGPFTLAVSPDRNHLYCGTRETPQLISFRIDQSGGGLTQMGTVPLDSWPVYVNTDRRGRFVLSSYYQGARVAVHPIGDDGSVGEAPVVSLETATGAHAMQTDPTNSYAFVPHIAGNGPNQIWQFKFDENTGQITPNSPSIVEPKEFLGPRHFCFHPSLDVLYFSNEQGCSVSGYRLDAVAGTLSIFQTITTLPPEGFAERNTCSQIQITGAGRFLYAPNRAMTASPVTRWTPAPANWPPTASLLQRQDPTRCALALGTGTSTRPARIRARWPYSASIPIPAR